MFRALASQSEVGPTNSASKLARVAGFAHISDQVTSPIYDCCSFIRRKKAEYALSFVVQLVVVLCWIRNRTQWRADRLPPAHQIIQERRFL